MKEFFMLSLIRFRSLRSPSSFLGCKDYYHYEQDNSENDQQQAYLQRREGKRMCGQVRLTKMEDSISQKKKRIMIV